MARKLFKFRNQLTRIIMTDKKKTLAIEKKN